MASPQVESGQVLPVALADELARAPAALRLGGFPQLPDLLLQRLNLGFQCLDIGAVGVAVAAQVLYQGLVFPGFFDYARGTTLRLDHLHVDIGERIAQSYQALLTIGNILLQQVHLGQQVAVQVFFLDLDRVVDDQKYQHHGAEAAGHDVQEAQVEGCESALLPGHEPPPRRRPRSAAACRHRVVRSHRRYPAPGRHRRCR